MFLYVYVYIYIYIFILYHFYFSLHYSMRKHAVCNTNECIGATQHQTQIQAQSFDEQKLSKNNPVDVRTQKKKERKRQMSAQPLRIPRLVHRVWFDLGSGAHPPEEKYGEMRASFLRHHALKEPQWPPPATEVSIHKEHVSEMVDRAERIACDADFERDDPNGQWRVIQWSKPMADEFVARRYAWFVPYWETYKEPIFQIDAIRYLVLCALGGVYLDQDILFYRNIEPMLRDPGVWVNIPGLSRGVVLIESKRVGVKGINNYVIASERGNDFMTHVVSGLVVAHESVFHLRSSFIGTMRVAGPLFLERSLATYQSIHHSDPDKLRGIVVLAPASFLSDTQKQRHPYDFSSQTSQPLPSPLSVRKWGGRYASPSVTYPLHDTGYGIHQFGKSWGCMTKVICDIARVIVVLAALVVLILIAVLVNKTHCTARNKTSSWKNGGQPGDPGRVHPKPTDIGTIILAPA